MSKYFIVLAALFLLLLPAGAQEGQWLNDWKKIKKEFKETSGKKVPKSAMTKVLSAINGISDKLKTIDQLYKSLQKLKYGKAIQKNKELKKAVEKFAKALDEFTTKRHEYTIYIEKEVNKKKKKKLSDAYEKFQHDCNKLEIEMYAFINGFKDHKKEIITLKLNLLSDDKTTICFLEPECELTIKVVMSGKGAKYKKLIKASAEIEIQKIRKQLIRKIKEIDDQLLEDMVDLILEEKLEEELQKALQDAQELWHKSQEKVISKIDKIINEKRIELERYGIIYRKYKTKVAKKVMTDSAKIMLGTGQLIVSNGAAVNAYLTIAKSIVNIAKTIKGFLEGPEKSGNELMKDINEYVSVNKKIKERKTVNLGTASLVKKEEKLKESIPEKIIEVQEKTSRVYNKLKELSLQLQKLEEEKKKFESEKERLGDKFKKIETSIADLELNFDKLFKQVETANTIIEVASKMFRKTQDSKLLQYKERIEKVKKAYEAAKAIKKAGKTFLEYVDKIPL